MLAPRPLLIVASCVAASLLGDGSLYVVLPVVFASRGLQPWQVGIILSANRWIRLLTNGPAARLLGFASVRTTFSCALIVGGLTSVTYGITSAFPVIFIARLFWGACWSVIRLTGLLVVTDCVDANLAPESSIGKMTGLFAGLSRLGSAFGMALGGIYCDALGFDFLFVTAGMLTMLAGPFAFVCAFGPLPRVSTTAAQRLEENRKSAAARGGTCSLPRLSAVQMRLFALAFSASCAGNGLIVSTLGAVLASHSAVDATSGKSYLDLGIGHVETASFNGIFIGLRWALEGSGALVFGKLVDRYGWRLVAPTAFGLSSTSGIIGFVALRIAEVAGRDASGLLLVIVLGAIVCFFLCISAADICVKSMGVRMRQQPLLVQGDDLGAAVGPLLGYALLQAELPPSAVIATQATVHAIATLVALAAVRADPHSGGVRATSPVRSGTEVAIQRVALAAEHDDGGDEER